jgi:dihydroflavonol-4-reductase
MSGVDLVTGGCGFLGRHVVAALRARARPVRVLDIADPAGLPEDVEVVAGSVTDARAVARALPDVRRIFHLAAVPELWARDPDVFERVNHQGTVTVLEAARGKLDLEAFVYTGSEVTLVPRRGLPLPARLDETLELPPESLIGAYAAAKRRAEQAVLAAAASGVPAISAIPTMPLGPADVHRTPPTRMVADFLAGRTPAYADVMMNVVDARDCAEGHVRAAEQGTYGRRYLLAGSNVTMSALLGELSLVCRKRMPHRRIPLWLARGFARLDTFFADTVTGRPPTAPRAGVEIACRQRPFDAQRARAELGFTTRPLSVTLADTVAWLERTE